jgi:hypothetical protein
MKPWSFPYPKSNNPTPPSYVRFILILSSHLRLSHPTSLFPSGADTFPRHPILEHWRCSFNVRDLHKATGSIIVQVSDILWELILAPASMFLFCPPPLSFLRDLKVLTAVLVGMPVAWEVMLCRWRFVSDVSKQRSAFICNRKAVSWRWKHCVAWERWDPLTHDRATRILSFCLQLQQARTTWDRWSPV